MNITGEMDWLIRPTDYGDRCRHNHENDCNKQHEAIDVVNLEGGNRDHWDVFEMAWQ